MGRLLRTGTVKTKPAAADKTARYRGLQLAGPRNFGLVEGYAFARRQLLGSRYGQEKAKQLYRMRHWISRRVKPTGPLPVDSALLCGLGCSPDRDHDFGFHL